MPLLVAGIGARHESLAPLVTVIAEMTDEQPSNTGDEMAEILFVRIKSGLGADEMERRINERLPRFRDVPGLVQKIYGRDEATGDVCGIYFFEDRKSLAAFRESELAKTIPTAYEALDVRPEVFDVLFPLYPEKGPPLERSSGPH